MQNPQYVNFFLQEKPVILTLGKSNQLKKCHLRITTNKSNQTKGKLESFILYFLFSQKTCGKILIYKYDKKKRKNLI